MCSRHPLSFCYLATQVMSFTLCAAGGESKFEKAKLTGRVRSEEDGGNLADCEVSFVLKRRV